MFVPYLDYIQTEYDVIFLHCKNDMEYSRLQIKANAKYHKPFIPINHFEHLITPI